MFPEIEFRETLGLAAVRAPFAHIRYLGRIFRTLQQARYKFVAWCMAKGLPKFNILVPSQQRESPSGICIGRFCGKQWGNLPEGRVRHFVSGL